jgi:hypothetical protein
MSESPGQYCCKKCGWSGANPRPGTWVHPWVRCPECDHVPAMKIEPSKQDWALALQSLTPGGSEYVDDPARCVAFVREAREGPMEMLKRFKQTIDRLELELKQKDETLRWRLTSEEMPTANVPVIARYVNALGNERRIRAMWAALKSLECVVECCDDADYDEDTDTYWCRPGWYEENEHEETHWWVDEEVTHWLPLPLFDAKPTEGLCTSARGE